MLKKIEKNNRKCCDRFDAISVNLLILQMNAAFTVYSGKIYNTKTNVKTFVH